MENAEWVRSTARSSLANIAPSRSGVGPEHPNGDLRRSGLSGFGPGETLQPVSFFRVGSSATLLLASDLWLLSRELFLLSAAGSSLGFCPKGEGKPKLRLNHHFALANGCSSQVCGGFPSALEILCVDSDPKRVICGGTWREIRHEKTPSKENSWKMSTLSVSCVVVCLVLACRR